MPDSADNKPRVLILHNFLSPYRVPLFNALADRLDLDVWFLGDVRTIRDWPPDAREARFRHRVLPNWTLGFGSRYDALLLNYSLPVALARHRFDAIIVCGWAAPAMVYAALHARMTGTPFIVWSGSTAGEPGLARSLSRPFVRALVRSAKSWIAYGARAMAYLESLGADRDKTFRAYNTVETGWFASECAQSGNAVDALRDQLNLGGKPVALYCGNLLDLKGVSDLLEAFARAAPAIPDVHLVLVGSGAGEARYRAMCDSLGIADRVRFTGFVDRKRLPAYYALADVLVLPSRREIWGLVLIEALACGVPVIATDACGATADLIQHRVNGLVVPARNPAALAEAMQTYFSNPAQQDAMTAAAAPSIEPFSIGRAADAFVDAVRLACDPRRA